MMNELRILSKIQDIKKQWEIYENDNLPTDYNTIPNYWDKEDLDNYNAHCSIFQAKIDVLMEILQNE